jgi:SAM-dependent methyltransferase
MSDAQGRLIWAGQYDLYALWKQFGIPDDLRGQSVIDIGTASGFFAFECEKRGAAPVVATEIADISNWDSRSGVSYGGVNIPRENQRDFAELHDMLKSRVRLQYCSITDPAVKAIGTFDWVIFGSLITHVRDIMLALENVRALTKGRAIVIASYVPGEANPVLHWIQSQRPFDWWCPAKCLVPKMLAAAGFGRVEEVSDFVLEHADGSRHKQACWHAYP